MAAPRKPAAPAGPRAARLLRGFTLLELSVVLVIIAVIVGAVSMGGDLMRSANSQRIFADFVVGWSQAFSSHVRLAKLVPGDDTDHPRNIIGGASGPALLCNSVTPLLSNTMLAHDLALPTGQGPGREDRYVYQDSNGSPHELQVCFITRPWSVPGKSVGLYLHQNRHVMRITGLTVELAMQLDSLIDGRLDARFGRFRRVEEADRLPAAGVAWPPVRTHAGEDNLAEVQADLEM